MYAWTRQVQVSHTFRLELPVSAPRPVSSPRYVCYAAMDDGDSEESKQRALSRAAKFVQNRLVALQCVLTQR